MKRKNKYIMYLIVTVMILSLSGCKKNTKKEFMDRTNFMMDTVMTIKVFDSNDEKILDEVFERIEEIESKMSRTIEDSDINLINENAGVKPVEVSEDVYLVIKTAKQYAEISNGAYDPTIGPLVNLWDINEEGEIEKDSIPSEEKILEEKSKVDFTKLELLEDNKVFLSEKDMILDLGGIAKGYAADEIGRILKEKGVESAIIDLGGDIYALGFKPVEQPWKIGIQNPFEHRGSYVGIAEIKNKSIVTSGDYERYFELDNVRYHHIIDSKTGYPANNELSAVSIISDNSMDGDAISTAVFILGKDKGLQFINELEGVDALLITKDSQIYMTDNFKDIFTLKNNGFKIK